MSTAAASARAQWPQICPRGCVEAPLPPARPPARLMLRGDSEGSVVGLNSAGPLGFGEGSVSGGNEESVQGVDQVG